MVVYSEELNMFTVHHYSPVPFLPYMTCMCIYPDYEILSLWLVQCGILTSMSTRRLKIDYCRLCLVFVGEALLLCSGSARTGLWVLKAASAHRSAGAAALRLDQTRPKSRTLAFQRQVSVEPAKLASLWSQHGEPAWLSRAPNLSMWYTVTPCPTP